MVLHVCGITLIAARIVHGFGLSRTGGISPERLVGTAVTWLLMVAMALLLIWQFALR
jgi:hypothetical protein